jgi:hypothetical protein
MTFEEKSRSIYLGMQLGPSCGSLHQPGMVVRLFFICGPLLVHHQQQHPPCQLVIITTSSYMLGTPDCAFSAGFPRRKV